MTKFKAWAIRTAWSAAAAGLTAVPAAPVLSMAAWKAAAFAVWTTVTSAVLIYARAQANKLPEVGP